MTAFTLQAYVVEDNLRLCESLVAMLHELTAVRVVASGHSQTQAAAWLAAHPQSWDLLLLDLFLEGGNGLSLVMPPAQRQPGQKVVVLSNYLNASVRKRSAQRGVDAAFDKSTELDALVDYCVRLCALRRRALISVEVQRRLSNQVDRPGGIAQGMCQQQTELGQEQGFALGSGGVDGVGDRCIKILDRHGDPPQAIAGE